MRTTTMQAWAAAAYLCAAPVVSAATRCVAPGGVGGCYPTIQAAVDASGPADVVNVTAGTYFENVRVPASKPGLEIAGRTEAPAAVLDPSPHSGRGIVNRDHGLAIAAARVTVRDLSIHNGERDAVNVTAPDVRLERLYIVGAEGAGVRLESGAANARVLSSEIRGTRVGVAIAAAGAVVEDNQVYGAVEGIQVTGERATLTRNGLTSGSYGIRATDAAGLAARSNHVVTHDFGISITEAVSPVVHGNEVHSSYHSLIVRCRTCTGAEVTRNTAISALFTGIRVTASSPGLLVQSNAVRGSGGVGISVGGSDVRVDANQVSGVGRGGNGRPTELSPCFWVTGDRHVFTRNTASRCSASGFDLWSGTGIYLEDNETRDSFETGFQVRSTAAVLFRNRALDNAQEGFMVDRGIAVDTVLDSNTASGNSLGFCDEGRGTVLRDNNFDTVGPCLFAAR